MARPNAVTSFASLLCLAGCSCQAVLGSVDVVPAPQSSEPPRGAGQTSGSVEGGGAPGPRIDADTPTTPGGGSVEGPVGGPALGGTLPPLEGAGQTSGSDDSGPLDPTPDAGSPPLVARPIVVDGPATEQERVGVDGGEPWLAACRGGVVVGILPTANPSEEVFGQRLTFIEPICATASSLPAYGDSPGEPSSAVTITLIRDESIVSWDDTGDFQGVPPTQVPDSRLLWVPQPATLCPDIAPVLVGLSGEYDPVAPDVIDTAAIRSLVIECAPLVVAPNGVDVSAADSGHLFVSRADSFSASGTASYLVSCAGGSVATQLQVSAGYWLDGFVLGCSSLRSPHIAGEPCSAERECQSGFCAPDGRCGP
jgi:hypothetical protein